MKVEVLWSAHLNGTRTITVDDDDFEDWKLDNAGSSEDDDRDLMIRYLEHPRGIWLWSDDIDFNDAASFGDDVELDDINILQEPGEQEADRG